jgi:RNA methyltransferase, TrmH family
VTPIRSRDNARVKRWARLVTDAAFRRSEKKAIVEGPHLVAEALQTGLAPLAIIVSESGLRKKEVQILVGRREPVVLGDHIFGIVADAETPPGIAAEISIPQERTDSGRAVVFLEGIQDPSNVGAILRTAAAFGMGEVVLDRACADAWSPKVLRAAMGGHFKVTVRQVADLGKELSGFQGKLVATVPAGGVDLKTADLSGRLGWIFGSEGKGLSKSAAERARLRVSIAMAPGSESLNVAATAAICLYSGSRAKP